MTNPDPHDDHYGAYSAYPPPYPVNPPKSRGAALGLSFIFPGIGHLYLGLMKRGLSFMLAFILNITLLPLIVITHGHNPLLGGSLFVPVVT